MTAKLLESVISAAIGACASVAVAYLQNRLNKRWSRPDQPVPSRTEE